MADNQSPSDQDDEVLRLPALEPFITTPLIQAHVGKERVKVFSVHEGLLKSQSLFFRGMLASQFFGSEGWRDQTARQRRQDRRCISPVALYGEMSR
ncbi:hypothetical protein AJ79_08507 [Helicocarpus griseus UAMH5409]|uniref:BTB domain-containing protein n=1 Tax=Helicocarpus griseus UAMH5409 TaxID=1447875 RepID=A0A2B7WRW1_9EURO|nr:hypothetical protein AJ79_08507 [Helicocarpus griseus UAMH5409]